MANEDFVDWIIAGWRRERPDINIEGKGIVCRILRLYSLYYKKADFFLNRYDLKPNEFSVLMRLRRAGEGGEMTQKQLLSEVLITSGAMTNLIGRLIKTDLVEKRSSEEDQREVFIRLTSKGLKIINEAMEVQAKVERDMVRDLKPEDKQELERLLKVFLLTIDDASMGDMM